MKMSTTTAQHSISRALLVIGRHTLVGLGFRHGLIAPRNQKRPPTVVKCCFHI
jgi:hypothetical protein